MSRADEFSTSTKSPVAKYLQWDSEGRTFKMYDKKTEAKGFAKLPIKFVVLRQMPMITGFHKPTQTGIYSNELTSSELNTKEFVVRTKNAELIKGIYSDIKPNLAAFGAKFGVNVYALMDGELVCIKLSGSSNSAWIDYTLVNRQSLVSNEVEVLSVLDKKNGATKYTQPVFTIGKTLDKATSDKAEEVYAELVSYMKERDSKPEVAELIHSEEVQQPVFTEAPEVSDLPF